MSFDEDILEELQELNSKIYHRDNPFLEWFGLILLLLLAPILLFCGLFRLTPTQSRKRIVDDS